MGFRFRKSINLGNGIRLNIGKKTVGLSAGRKGFRVSANSKGQKRVTAGIPGTGIYWTELLNKKKKKPPQGVGCLLTLLALIVVLGLVFAL